MNSSFPLHASETLFQGSLKIALKKTLVKSKFVLFSGRLYVYVPIWYVFFLEEAWTKFFSMRGRGISFPTSRRSWCAGAALTGKPQNTHTKRPNLQIPLLLKKSGAHVQRTMQRRSHGRTAT